MYTQSYKSRNIKGLQQFHLELSTHYTTFRIGTSPLWIFHFKFLHIEQSRNSYLSLDKLTHIYGIPFLLQRLIYSNFLHAKYIGLLDNCIFLEITSSYKELSKNNCSKWKWTNPVKSMGFGNLV